MPAFFAAGCCATGPLLFIFGVSVAEIGLQEYRWLFRSFAVVVLVVSLWWYFRRCGVITIADYRNHAFMIAVISLHTAVLSGVLYVLFVQVLTPLVWQRVAQQTVNCCAL